MNVKHKLEMFSKTALNEAKERRKAVEEEIKAEYERVCAEVAEKAKQEEEENFKNQKSVQEQRFSRETITIQTEAKKEYIRMRTELTDKIFETVHKRIEEFRKTPEYDDFMLSGINKAAEQYGYDIVIVLSASDMHLKTKIDSRITVEESARDFMGGFKALLKIERGSFQMKSVGEVYGINGPVLHIKNGDFRMSEMVMVGEDRLIGEIIGIQKDVTVVQVFEDTTGLKPGAPVYGTGKPLSVKLGPGIISGIFDGIQRPLETIAKSSGVFISRGVHVPSLDPERLWDVKITAVLGDKLNPGAIIAEIEETSSILHKVMIPPGVSGLVTKVVPSGQYKCDDMLVTLTDEYNNNHIITMSQEWPIREPRPSAKKRVADRPLITGQRVIDTLFPIAKGGMAALPGGFGTGKTMTQHQLAKWSDADIIIYIGCGERGNEMTQVLEDFAGLKDPRTGKSLMDRTALIANTSNMPVAAREASIYTESRSKGGRLMSIEYSGLNEISGAFAVLEGVKDPSFDEIVELKVDGWKKRYGKIVKIEGDRAIISVFDGTADLSLNNTTAKLTGHPMRIGLSEEILGRVFDGTGRPIDGLGEIYAECYMDVNGKAINPVSRVYPRNFIQTGISAIDGLATLIRGQKLPIFSGNGMPHDRLAAQIVRQASLGAGSTDKFGIVFAAMGVKYDVAEFFRRSFEESGAIERVVMFLNLANDPVAERIITPRAALTTAEYLAYEKNMHILVVLTDMTSYAEALREISSSKGEIPSRKGYPGYLYSEFASLYERAGIVKGSSGSVTQIPILTMPNDDITHPVPDLTGYITEGQIVLDRSLHQKGVYPPINILPSLSRLMKDGIGEGFTREDHPDLANQIFSSYAHVNDARALASVIGEDELGDLDKSYMSFGEIFERKYVNQNRFENRQMIDTIDLGWDILKALPKSELDRVKTELLDKYYKN
ncbi:v-type proton atpase subunit b [Holotrichia oblita]|nr:v-type proton atpase subunit b [Holotrichia oblita]